MEGPPLPPPPPPFDDDDKPDNPPVVFPHKTTTTTTTTTASGLQTGNKDPSVSPNAAISLPPPPGRDLDTYVVQFPRDQIYRVPPPENAKFAELYQKSDNEERSGCCKRLFWCFLVLIILGVIAGAIVLFINLSFNPTAPTFSVEKLDIIMTKPVKPTKSAKSAKSTKSEKLEKPTPKTFEVRLRANNPNSKMGIKYKESSVNAVSISIKNKNIGNGKFPESSQDAKGSDKIDLKLQASKNVALPKAKAPATFTLAFDVDAEFIGAMKKKKKKVTVTCDIKAKGMGDERVKILSESCDSEFKN